MRSTIQRKNTVKWTDRLFAGKECLRFFIFLAELTYISFMSDYACIPSIFPKPAKSKSVHCLTCTNFCLIWDSTISSKCPFRNEKKKKNSDFRYIPFVINLQSVRAITIIINKSDTEFKRPAPPLERLKILFILVWSAKC